MLCALLCAETIRYSFNFKFIVHFLAFTLHCDVYMLIFSCFGIMQYFGSCELDTEMHHGNTTRIHLSC